MSIEKNMERKLRRALAKQGYQLHKSRSRNGAINDRLGYMIVNAFCGTVECGEHYDLTLADVAAFANG